MARLLLHVVTRTPRDVVLDCLASSLRVPTQTGQVGLRPHGEPTVLAVEPGLIVVRSETGYRYAGTAGGLLQFDGSSASLLTPLAVVGDDLEAVQAELDRVLAAPSAEMEVRRTLGRLERNILREVQRGERPAERPGSVRQ